MLDQQALPSRGFADPVEAGRKGGLARKAKKVPTSLEEIQEDKLFVALYLAANGMGSYKDLPSDKRLAALKLLLEYKVGRPRQAKEIPEEDSNDGSWGIGVAG